MNIFILDDSPTKAARMLCDQHIHKMILESAQLLSTAFHNNFPNDAPKLPIYKPAYQNNPCTLWVSKDLSNASWLILHAQEMEEIRVSKGFNPHASAKVIEVLYDYIQQNVHSVMYNHMDHTPFSLAMPAHIRIRPSLDPVLKYQDYYKFKHRQWLDNGGGMTYNVNPVPDFMKEYF